MNCRLHVGMAMRAEVQHAAFCSSISEEKTRKKRMRTILRCAVPGCWQVGYEPQADLPRLCSRCGQRIPVTPERNWGVYDRCPRCRKGRTSSQPKGKKGELQSN